MTYRDINELTPLAQRACRLFMETCRAEGLDNIYNRDVPLAKTSERAVCTGQDGAGQDCNMDEKQPPYKPKGMGYSL